MDVARKERPRTEGVLTVSASIRIARPIDVVRSHFGDVDHHAKNPVHRGVEFTLLATAGTRSRFRKRVHILGIPLVDEVILSRQPDGTITEEFVSGSNAGGNFTSRFRAEGSEATNVEATVELPLRGLRRLAAPLIRLLVRRQLGRALGEDRRDLEEGGYQP